MIRVGVFGTQRGAHGVHLFERALRRAENVLDVVGECEFFVHSSGPGGVKSGFPVETAFGE